MNQTQALSKLRKMLGDRLAYRIEKNAPDAEGRARALAEWQAAKQAADDAEVARAARMESLLANDETYQQLKARATELKKAQNHSGAGRMSYRITVGTLSSMFFSVHAEGDNWGEVVEQVCKSKVPA